MEYTLGLFCVAIGSFFVAIATFVVVFLILNALEISLFNEEESEDDYDAFI